MKGRGRGAFWVASGIFLSRIAGLARSRAFAAYFGNSEAADAFNAALKIPNFLQNLFGEGVLSGSFIPAYAGLLAQGDETEARRLAAAIATWLALVVSLLAALGAWLTPGMIELVAPGFVGEKRELTIALVRIFFPGTALLVMSAWCLGILNSHRRFFLSYAAPVVWNAAIIAALLWYGGFRPRGLDARAQAELAMRAGWGLVLGCFLQLLIQAPTALRLLGSIRPSFHRTPAVQGVFIAFGPVVVARGVVQLSAYVDQWLASWLPSGSVAALSYAQLIYTLPVSLFGMSIAAASLPEMSGDAAASVGGETPEPVRAALRAKLEAGFAQIAFFIVPSTSAFLFLGDRIAGALFQTGAFSRRDSAFVWSALAGSAVGLLAGTLGRLCSSTFYALKDPKRPLRFAIIRVCLTTALGYVAGLKLPEWLGLDASWGVAGLTASAGTAGWVEFALLRRSLAQRIGPANFPKGRLAKLWLSALVASAIGCVCGLAADAWLFGQSHPVASAAAALGPFALAYLALAAALGVPQAERFARAAIRRRGA